MNLGAATISTTTRSNPIGNLSGTLWYVRVNTHGSYIVNAGLRRIASPIVSPYTCPWHTKQTIFALIPGEALVTYTTNCLSEQYETLQPVFAKITNSFKIGSI